MSIPPLQALLLDAGQAGAFYLTAEDIEPLRDAAIDIGFHSVPLDLAGCTGKTELLHRIGIAFQFPPDLGSNWDALADALGDLQWLPADGYVLGIEHPQQLRDVDAESYASLVSILEECSLQWRDQGLPFWTFIALPDGEFEALAS